MGKKKKNTKNKKQILKDLELLDFNLFDKSMDLAIDIGNNPNDGIKIIHKALFDAFNIGMENGYRKGLAQLN